MAQITGNGVQARRLQEWYNAVVEFKRAVWGPNYSTDPTTKQGVDCTQLAELLYNAEQNNISAYGQLNPNTAVGINLDYLGIIRGIHRNGGTPQQIRVTITSTATGYSITPSLVFRTMDGMYSYYSPSTIEITDTTQNITLVYSQDGNPPVVLGDGLQTVDYFPQITSIVISSDDAIPSGIQQGTDTESDASYRKRILDATLGFIGTLELMHGEMLTVPGMAKNIIYSNESDTTDSRGITPYATEFVVAPDSLNAGEAFNQLVATKICDVKVPGAPLYGTNTTVELEDYFGEPKTIPFTMATRKDIEFYVRVGVNVQTNILDTTQVPAHQIQIQDYINSILKIGEPVQWSILLGMVAADTGYVILGWGIRFKGDTAWTNADLSLGIREYAWVASLDDIQISPNPEL